MKVILNDLILFIWAVPKSAVDSKISQYFEKEGLGWDVFLLLASPQKVKKKTLPWEFSTPPYWHLYSMRKFRQSPKRKFLINPWLGSRCLSASIPFYCSKFCSNYYRSRYYGWGFDGLEVRRKYRTFFSPRRVYFWPLLSKNLGSEKKLVFFSLLLLFSAEENYWISDVLLSQQKKGHIKKTCEIWKTD